jgi:hypothetical protein
MKLGLLLVLLGIATLAFSQSAFEDGECITNSGDLVKGKFLFKSMPELQDGISIKIDGIVSFMQKDKLKRLKIGRDNVYEHIILDGKDQIVEVLNEGAIKLYYTYDGWLYLSKEGEQPIRLELYVTHLDDQNKKIDTLNQTKTLASGKFNYRKNYLTQISKRMEGSLIKVNPKIELKPNYIKNLVAVYNSTRPDIPSKKNFKSSTQLSFFGGYGSSQFFEENKKYQGIDYYLEVQNTRVSRLLSFYVSHRPFINIDDSKFSQTSLGIRVYLYNKSFIYPYINLGSQFYGLETPQVTAGYGLKCAVTKNLKLVFDVYNFPFKNYRAGIESSIRL